MPSTVSTHSICHAHNTQMKVQAAQRVHADLSLISVRMSVCACTLVFVCVLARLKMTLGIWIPTSPHQDIMGEDRRTGCSFCLCED